MKRVMSSFLRLFVMIGLLSLYANTASAADSITGSNICVNAGPNQDESLVACLVSYTPLNDSADTGEFVYEIKYNNYINDFGHILNGGYTLTFTIDSNSVATSFNGGPVLYSLNGTEHTVVFNNVSFNTNWSSYTTTGTVTIDGSEVNVDGVNIFPFFF